MAQKEYWEIRQEAHLKEIATLKRELADALIINAKQRGHFKDKLSRRNMQIKELKAFKDSIKAHIKLLRIVLEEEIDRNGNDYPEINNECKEVLEIINR